MKWTDNINVEHISFGMVLGNHNIPIKSQAGNTPKLLDLINDGINETKKEFLKRKDTQTLSEYDESIIIPVTIGSIKYYELSKCRDSTYQFRYDEMLRFDGNTYTYLIYSLARCRGVIEKYLANKSMIITKKINYDELNSYDTKLLKKIICFPEILQKTFDTQMPHHLCEYTHGLVSTFHEHYAKARCMNFDVDNNLIEYNYSRIQILFLIKKLLETIYDLLGLPIVDKI